MHCMVTGHSSTASVGHQAALKELDQSLLVRITALPVTCCGNRLRVEH